MGAAAVFETAAETPPTDKGLVAAFEGKIRREFLSSKLGAIGPQFRWRITYAMMKRTQEVDHKAGLYVC